MTHDSSDKEIIFAISISPTKRSVTSSVVLVESIRAFAGALAQAEIWCYVPEQSLELFSELKNRMVELN
ncbi:MAG: hypothetical protein ACTSV2_11295, partial [Candidatus Thorarchaeota archaeon]